MFSCMFNKTHPLAGWREIALGSCRLSWTIVVTILPSRSETMKNENDDSYRIEIASNSNKVFLYPTFLLHLSLHQSNKGVSRSNQLQGHRQLQCSNSKIFKRTIPWVTWTLHSTWSMTTIFLSPSSIGALFFKRKMKRFSIKFLGWIYL